MSAAYRIAQAEIGRHGAALVVSAAALLLSALLTALALRVPDLQWLGCLSFLPLFAVIRRLRPRTASLAGGVWGSCLYLCLFCLAGPTPAIDPAVSAVGPSAYAPAQPGSWAWLLATLIVIPAIYVGLATRLARARTGSLPAFPAIGLNTLLLALGWTLIEAVLHLHNLFGPHDGLLTGSQGEGPHVHWFVRLLGYVCTAFLVACANASLVSILSDVRLRFPAGRSLAGSPNAVAWAPLHVITAIESWPIREAYPRAPPIPVVAGGLMESTTRIGISGFADMNGRESEQEGQQP